MTAFPPLRLTAPADPVVDLATIKAHCRMEHDDTHDATLEAYVAAATGHLDGRSGILGRALVTQTWRNAFSAWPTSGMIDLVPGPVASFDSLEYRQASDGAWTAIDITAWETLSSASGGVLVKPPSVTWPELSSDYLAPIRVDFTAGSAAADVPAEIVQAIKLMAGNWFENREAAVIGSVDATELPMGVKALLAPHKHRSF